MFAWSKNYDIKNVFTYKQRMVDFCSDGKCNNAVQTLAKVLHGNATDNCNLLKVIYSGQDNEEHYVGVRPNVLKRIGYVLSLVSIGAMTESIYLVESRAEGSNEYYQSMAATLEEITQEIRVTSRACEHNVM